MANKEKKSNISTRRIKPKVKRRGVHSKNNNLKKKYRGQGK